MDLGYGHLSTEIPDGEMKLSYSDGQIKEFKAFGLHFHSPSEHKINGKSFDLEMHIVHVDKFT